MKITPVHIQQINDLLDTYRERHNISSDEKLAAIVGTSDTAIYRWRNGRIDKSALILLAMDRDVQSPTHPTPA